MRDVDAETLDAVRAELRRRLDDAEIVELRCFAVAAIDGVKLSRIRRVEP